MGPLRLDPCYQRWQGPLGPILGLVVRHSLILGLAVLALATVQTVKTGACAQTADLVNPTY